MSEACRVPLIDLLGGVPPDARLLIVEDGGMSSHSIPVGRYSAEAAAELRRLQAEVWSLRNYGVTAQEENDRLKAEVEALRKDKAIVDFLIGEKMLFCWIDKDGDGSFTAVRAIGQVTVEGVESVDVRTAVAAALAARPGGERG